MSYFLADANGHLGDFASTGGLRTLLARTDLPALQKFFDKGEADDALAADVASECAGDRECDYIARLMREAEAPVVLCDGTSGEDDSQTTTP